MRRTIASSLLFSVLLGGLLASCGAPPPDPGECQSDAECGSLQGCKQARCELHKCVEKDAPEGSLAGPDFQAPPCHRVVCDGKGAERVEVDPGAAVQDTPGDCMKNSCDTSGNL